MLEEAKAPEVQRGREESRARIGGPSRADLRLGSRISRAGSWPAVRAAASQAPITWPLGLRGNPEMSKSSS